MIVLTLTDCPLSLKGDLTKWLIEIHTGVYVGKVSARVRDELWKRILKEAKSGQATLVYPAKNEQKMIFRVHNTVWQPIDFDGITLMMRPSPKRMEESTHYNSGYSHASKFLKANRMTRRRKAFEGLPRNYTVLNISTSGDGLIHSTLTEITAMKFRDGASSQLHLVNYEVNSPSSFYDSIQPAGETGHGHEFVSQHEAITKFIAFCENDPIITHDVNHCISVIKSIARDLKIEFIENKMIDLMNLSRQMVKGLDEYTVDSILKELSLEPVKSRSCFDICSASSMIYEKMITSLDENQ